MSVSLAAPTLRNNGLRRRAPGLARCSLQSRSGSGPLGIVGGRVIWLRLADQLGVFASTITPALVLLVVAVGTFVLANLVALAPARVAGRTRAALVLSSQ